MNIRLSGLGRRSIDGGRELAARILELPVAALQNFAPKLREVAIRVAPVRGGVRGGELAECRVTVRRRHGPSIAASARGAEPESAARRALSRARQMLAREDARRISRRTRAVAG